MLVCLFRASFPVRLPHKAVNMHLGVAQMEARYLGVVEAAGSNPVTQTKNPKASLSDFLFVSVGHKCCVSRK